jgi:gamma-glutamyl:cysteine ligase YbdK (ATP-grasp superfamily)
MDEVSMDGILISVPRTRIYQKVKGAVSPGQVYDQYTLFFVDAAGSVNQDTTELVAFTPQDTAEMTAAGNNLKYVGCLTNID